MGDPRRTPNPLHLGSPAHMADARLFTDYRGNGLLMQGANTYERKLQIQETGQAARRGQRSVSVFVGGSTGCVDTMVPELSKRVCSWDGCRVLPSESMGIGQGRQYWPGESVADPDVMARRVTIPNSYPANAGLYNPAPAAAPRAIPVVPARRNRYSVPYLD